MKKIISRFFYFMGIVVQLKKRAFIPNSFKEIRKMLLTLRTNGDISSYSSFLNQYFNTKYVRTKFVGLGGSAQSTNTYTIIGNGNNIFFEKLYNVHSDVYKNIKDCYPSYRKDALSVHQYAPKMIKYGNGEEIGFVHFEYIKEKIGFESTDSFYEYGINLIKSFSRINTDHKTAGKWSQVYRLHLHLKSLSLKIYELFSEDHKLMSYWAEVMGYIETGKIVFTHGDFHSLNVYKNCIIDFDYTGYYPFGIDLGMLLYVHFKKKEPLFTFPSFCKELRPFQFTQEEMIRSGFFYLIMAEGDLSNEQIKGWIVALKNKIK